MKKDTVFIDWNTQHSKDANFLQIDLQVYCNFNQNINKVVFFYRHIQAYFKIYLKKHRFL